MIGVWESFGVFLYICQEQVEHPDLDRVEVGEDEKVEIKEEMSKSEDGFPPSTPCVPGESANHDVVENTESACEAETEDEFISVNHVDEAVSTEAAIPEKREAPCEPTEDTTGWQGRTTPTTSSVSEEEIEEKCLELGVIDEIFDFVHQFDSSSVSNALQASASSRDISGGISKPAIFEHPLNEGNARIEYVAQLPKISQNERLILCFNIGLRDGVNFNDSARMPNGVLFALELNGERLFEEVCITCQWSPEHVIDISHLAEQKIKVVFVTNCNGEGNSNCDWALWGEPRILLLSKVEQTEGGRRKAEGGRKEILPTSEIFSAEDVIFTRGVVLGQLEGEPARLVCLEYRFSEGKHITEIAELNKQKLEEIYKEAVSLTEVYSYQPKLKLVSLGPTTGIVVTMQDFDVRCVIENVGKVALLEEHNATISLGGIKLRRDRMDKRLGRIEPDGEVEITWQIRPFHRETIVPMMANLKLSTAKGTITEQVNASLVIEREAPKLPTKSAEELRFEENGDGLLLENEFMRVIFVRGNDGFGYYTLSVANDGNYQQVATGYPISEFAYRDSTGVLQSVILRPKEYQLEGNNRGESAVVFTAQEKDVDGLSWHFTARFSLGERLKRIGATYQLRAEGDKDLMYFRGPMLRVGDGAYGARKDFALFPGLEFLESNEPSSSARDAAPPINLRLVPHPYKITIPLMAVENERCLVGLIWNPLLKWDGEHDMLAAIFASPNFYERQDNHLMGLFLPTVPDWIPENLWNWKKGPVTFRVLSCRQTNSEFRIPNSEFLTPYSLKANTPLTINAEIIAYSKRRNSHPIVLDAIVHWTDAYGIPEPLEPPRKDEEELLLSRHGFMHSVWDEVSQKSRHCVGWAPTNCPSFATLLWYDYLATHDAEVKARVELIAQNTIRDSGIGGLASTSGCHILKWEFPFYYGGIEAALDWVKNSVEGIVSNQGEDGSWRFRPNERTQNLGREGDAVLGTCASNALVVLKYARISGDETALQAGQKALEFMNRFKVPKGAQAWECPLYEPDILAAAWAIGAYVEAYRMTKARNYLEQAEYWAKTGLPFLFFWNNPQRPGMKYASIPVFGTTFYTHSWFGVPVQWNGLVYAYYLQHLAEYSGIFPWRQIAEGITVSAMYQQWTEGEVKGTYPDGFYGYCTEGRGPHINPEDIMVNLYALRGLDPDISTAIVPINDARIHISSGAKVQDATLSLEDAERTIGDASQPRSIETLKFNLQYAQNEISYTLIRRFGKLQTESNFYSITANGETLPEIENLKDIPTGCYSYQEPDTIYLKLLHPLATVNIEIRRGEIPQEKELQESVPPPPVEHPDEFGEVTQEEQPVEKPTAEEE
ncbi:hypothetical protein FJZ31_24685 [Candidatus Poribacteria bacterium]|nr:hypothetical protein [Candidatus Poribacteria bacterium]